MKDIIVLGIILVAVILGVPALVYFERTTACQELSEMSEVDTVFKFWNGCYVKDGGKWIPVKRWMHNTGN